MNHDRSSAELKKWEENKETDVTLVKGK